ncbi:MAG: hypothetical protein ACLSFA_03680 [Roseburia inulinivorans]
MGVDIVEKDIDGCKVAYFIDKSGILLLFESEWMKMVLLSEKNLCSCFALMGKQKLMAR